MNDAGIKKTKKAMIQEMLDLGILDEPNAKALARCLFWQVERTYKENVPRPVEWLAKHKGLE